MRKRKIVLITGLLCCLALLAAGTTAYFTAEEKVYNIITTANLDIELHSETSAGVALLAEPLDDVMPGNEVERVVYVKNVGDSELYTRISLEKVVKTQAENLPSAPVLLDIDTQNWQEADGYYYYMRVLKPGESTAPLFTTVTFEKGMDNRYMDAKVEINVTAQAVQSAHNGTDALLAQGWPANQ